MAESLERQQIPSPVKMLGISTILPSSAKNGSSPQSVFLFPHKNWKTGRVYCFELIFVLISFTVSAKLGSFFIFFSTCWMEYNTVEWSRLSNTLPMSTAERFVMERIRYMAICRA